MNNDRGRVGNIAERAKRVGCWLIRGNMKTTFRDGFGFNKNEIQAIKEYYSRLGINPIDAKLETLAQTWSEECRSVASECQTVADLIGKTTEVLNDVKDGLFEGLN